MYIVLRMSAKRPSAGNSRIMIFILIAAALFLFLDPFGLFRSGGNARPFVNSDNATSYARYLKDAAQAADSYLLEAVRSHQIVYLSELGGVADEIGFLNQVLPDLVQEGGLNAIGLYFLLAADQAEIDRLMTGVSFDTALADKLLFNRLVLWGYREYRDLLETAWRINQTASLKVLGLNLAQDYSQIVSEDDVRDPEKVKTILSNGIPDRVMSRALINWFQQNPNGKVLNYIVREQGFPRLDSHFYGAQLEAWGYENERTFARLVHEAGYNDDFALTFHSAWPSSQSAGQIAYPASGAVDAAFDVLKGAGEAPELPVGFDVAGPLADVGIVGSLYDYGFEEEGEPKFSWLFDGYLVLKPYAELSKVTPIPNFINEGNFEEALRRFPGPDPRNATVDGLNSYMAGYADSRVELHSQMK